VRQASSEPERSQLKMTSQNFNEIVGENLSGVTFVRDYLQLQFNPPPMINAYTPVVVSADGKTATFGEEHFANTIIRQIGKVVRTVDFRDGIALDLTFEDNSLISISLRPWGTGVSP